MAQKAILEYDAKRLMNRYLKNPENGKPYVSEKIMRVTEQTDLIATADKNPWLKKEKLVAKPDQLIKRRGKNNLLLLNKPFVAVSSWLNEKMNSAVTIDKTEGVLNNFIVEPFIAHDQKDEYYICIRSVREGDEILFYHEGGIEVGDVDSKAEKILITVNGKADEHTLKKKLLKHLPEERKEKISWFIFALFEFYRELQFAYLEINPFVFTKEGIVVPLDVAARLDDTAWFECEDKWGAIAFPPPFGRNLSEEEKYIAELDSRTGASLKLTLLNPEGRIWTLIAGGGASVIFADTITDLGYGKELANYGEYSGDPDEEMTFEYAKTVLDLMTRKPDEGGKVLLIGGGIANFTDVAKTFKGIIRSIRVYEKKLKENKTKIFVRRAGPNYKEGLERMKNLGTELGIPIEVFGPETHMTQIVPMAVKSL